MFAHETISYQLEIYFGNSCWRGGVHYSSSKRITELLNDDGHGYIDLEHAELIDWATGIPRVVSAFDNISVSKRNAIAVVCNDVPSGEAPKIGDHVIKVPHKVALYAPPIAIVGNLHAIKDAQVIGVLDLSRTIFLPITSAQVTRMDGQPPLSHERGLVLVNREAITAVQTLAPEPDASPSETVAPPSEESSGSRMIAVANKISQRKTD